MSKSRKVHKIIAFFLAINILQSVLPYNLLYASNNGPNAPEAAGFEPVNATDMVNLASGDMAYVLPVMEVGGLPISLSYHGGIPLDLESTWTGLGWNINTGAINRGLSATPDDWKGGNSLDFIRYSKAEEIYTINVGYGISSTCEVGVGASWGSNKSMSGSVFASVGFKDHFGASASISTDGNYSLGVSAGTGKNGSAGESFGGGIGISGNLNTGKISASAGVGVRTSEGMTIGLGASLDGGVGASLGYSNMNSQGGMKGAGAGGSLSMASFSSGDWEISSSGWYIPIQTPFLVTFGFGKQKVTYKLKKGYRKAGFGILYNNNLNNNFDAIEVDTNADGVYADYQNRYRYADAYEQSLPVSEKEFVGDYDAEREKLNFIFSAYDSYDVNATGISGTIKPKILQNSTVFGLGYAGTDPYNTQGNSTDIGKMRVYWHNTLTTTKNIGNANSINNINFYFDGQFTQNVAANGYVANNALGNPLTPLNNNLTSLQSILTSRGTTQNPRLSQGNFIEVFTNQQIISGNSNGLLSPLNPASDGLSLQALSRNDEKKYKPDGIGGYKITAPDGKVYHFSQPVYHFEMVERNVLKDNSETSVSEKRQYTPYATHWLLTAITGPDYIDTNNNNIADPADYGYWVRMDYGKWSDGYVWRNPTDKSLKDYTTNIEKNIGTEDFGTYQFGRKQLYYLDKVVSSTHTAYFVKDLRYDSVGSDLSYQFTTDSNFPANEQNITNNGSHIPTALNPAIQPFENFTYKRQLQLMLKKIVLVKNSDAVVSKGSINNPLQLNSQGVSDYIKNYTLNFNASGDFFQEYNVSGQPPQIDINIESGVYDVKDFEGFDYGNAVKVVDFEYNYNLAVKDHTNTNNDENKSNGSPGTIQCSLNPNKGKLCLKKVRFLGRNNFDYMPPYEFEYKGEYKGASFPYIKYPANAIVKKELFNGAFIFKNNWRGVVPSNVSYQQNGTTIVETPIADARAKDEWGFLKDLPGQESEVAAAAWTMTKIKTPTGASIEFEHEEDDFFVEAFSRRYWTDNLKIKAVNLGSQLELEIKNQDGLQSSLMTPDFSRYFKLNERVYIDYWLCKIVDENCVFSSFTDRGKINILPDDNCIVSYVDQYGVKILVDKVPDFTLTGNDPGRALNTFYSKGGPNNGSNAYVEKPRGVCPTPNGGCGGGIMRDHSMKYRVLANKVPEDENGGGLRVKSITLKDENNNKYKTRYYYNVPDTNPAIVGKDKTDPTYKSSGITSYSPIKGQKFVPYQSELPSPGVMYEYVTMVAESSTGETLGKTVYNFYTLQPLKDIFDEQIEMKDRDGTIIFKANVIDHNTNSNYLNPSRKILAKSMKLDVNTSLIGQIRALETYNKFGQLLTSSKKKYLSGYALKAANINRGSITESFQSMKSIFTSNKDDNNLTIKKRLLSVSTREDFSSVLQSITTVGANGKMVESYSKTDPATGAFLIVETEKADGTKKRVERVPAYTKYPEMGSKAVNLNNRNMLSQEAMTITSVERYGASGSWMNTGAAITTWKKEWTYRDNIGLEQTPVLEREKIWRKHKSFVYKSDSPYFHDYNSITTFNWQTGSSTNNNWKKVSEITRYNHFSSPVETKDVNNNFASSKMADKQNKVIVSGNARYTEMYYSGAEYVDENNSLFFEGEVLGAQYRTDEVAHTGKYSVKTTDNNAKVFEVNGVSGSANYYQTPDNYQQTFRPGKYKVSFWGYDANRVSTGTKLIVNNQEINVSETIKAGCWRQFNYYFDIIENQAINIHVKNSGASNISGGYFYDDFRLSPISSSVNSYVYDNKTDELVTVLDANNLGKTFVYDNAGRLLATYVETVDAPTLSGGFKITGQYKQKFKGIESSISSLPLLINNCKETIKSVYIGEIDLLCKGSFENTFRINTKDGSGNFTYQYKWLVDEGKKTYSDFVIGDNVQTIPYVMKACEDGNFDKTWDFTVRVTDNLTGKYEEKSYVSNTKGCQFKPVNQADLEVSKCNSNCNASVYSFRIHLTDNSTTDSYKLEYAYYNPELSLEEQNYIDVTASKGRFCPVLRKTVDANCTTSGYRDYINLVYRVTNITQGKVLPAVQALFSGGCSETNSEYTTIKLQGIAKDYLKEGYLVKLDSKGNVLEVTDINKQVK